LNAPEREHASLFEACLHHLLERPARIERRGVFAPVRGPRLPASSSEKSLVATLARTEALSGNVADAAPGQIGDVAGKRAAALFPKAILC
jgi:hypothetical protein